MDALTNEQLLGLVRKSAPHLRAEAEAMAREICYLRRRRGLDCHNSPAQDDTVFRQALAAACVRLFRRETEPFLRAITRVRVVSMPRYSFTTHTHTGATSIEQVDDGLTPETRAFVDHMHACIRAYAEILQLQLDPVIGPPAAAKAGHQP